MLDYFKPDNAISFAIVILIWVNLYLWWRAMQKAGLAYADSFAAIKYFNETVSDFAGLRETLGGRESPDNTRVIFRQHVREDVSSESVVVPHFEAIFAAGCYQGLLDVGELLRHTERTILEREAVRRTRLSIFLILGLLGTLFGLADSIVALLNLMKGNSDAAANMTELLSGLRGAFSPSLSGVMATVLGTYLYSRYQQKNILPLLAEFRASTLYFWVPRLYPTTQQVAIEAAQKMMAEAKVVAEFATSIKRDSGQLQSNLQSAALFTGTFQKGMEHLSNVVGNSATKTEQMLNQMVSHLERFREASDRWSSFETKLLSFYTSIEQAQGKVVENSASLKEQIAQQTANINILADAVQKSSVDALKEVRLSLSEVSQRMSQLHAPFEDAAARMISSSQNLQLNFVNSNEKLVGIASTLATRSRELVAASGMEPGSRAAQNGTNSDGGDVVRAIEKLTRIVGQGQARKDWRFWRRPPLDGERQ
jgi:hypothetical protein